MEPPEALRVALQTLAEEYPRRALAEAAASLSSAYRDEGDAPVPAALAAPVAATAYAVTRLPATYAALASALTETSARLPEWRPHRLFDIGAGPGVSAWTAHTIWPSLASATLVERDHRMIAVGKRLMDEAPSGCDVTWHAADIIREPEALRGGPFDLCLISYALNELPHAERLPLVERLWKLTSGALVLVAPGTPAGFAAIREARGCLLDAGAHVVAPCPHGDVCPMAPGDWCHFSQRLARSRLHRQLKGGDAPYEDEKFAYVAAARMSVQPFAARVIRHPVVRSGHISLHLCTPEGLQQAEVTRSDKASWRSAREAHWGSSLAALPEKRRPL